MVDGSSKSYSSVSQGSSGTPGSNSSQSSSSGSIGCPSCFSAPDDLTINIHVYGDVGDLGSDCPQLGSVTVHRDSPVGYDNLSPSTDCDWWYIDSSTGPCDPMGWKVVHLWTDENCNWVFVYVSNCVATGVSGVYTSPDGKYIGGVFSIVDGVGGGLGGDPPPPDDNCNTGQTAFFNVS